MTTSTEQQAHRSDVLVVGGGIGGLSAALALAREGLRVRVLEQAEEFGEVGAGIQLAPNCTRILDDFGLLDTATRLGVVPTSMVMRDAVDGTDLTRLDLVDLKRTYGFPYLVIHRSDLHRLLLDACVAAGVELLTGRCAVSHHSDPAGARVVLSDGVVEEADVIVAADGLHSTARQLLSRDEPVSSCYVAYRGTVPMDQLSGQGVDPSEIAVYVGPGCHFVQYALRGGELLNQVAVFESPRAVAGEPDWGAPDELDHAFRNTCATVRQRIPSMWRDRWWRMFDRDPISTWVHGRIALLGDAAHPPLQYLAQGAIMAIEDGWVLGRQVARHRVGDTVDWPAALQAYQAVRVEHSRRVVVTARAWGELWHLDGMRRDQRNVLLRERDVRDYRFTDWLYGPTALDPADEPPMFPAIPLDSVDLSVQ